jgi:NHS family xanthosine MFS transporter
MGIKNRLTVMSFLQFFVWGAWLITIANWFGTMQWDGTQFGLFGTMGIAFLFMPTLTGIIADRFNAENYMSVTYFIWSSFILYPASCNT